ncbi:MAG: Na+/H+ antiporter NhaC [Candidatus Pelagadaptatus aseana]|uniref:Na+/H+ antiporter NhaC n=1 Tax=Candidatus Pelagadaptatus aseana TaxID=3120508 RepID=UPI0039B34318
MTIEQSIKQQEQALETPLKPPSLLDALFPTLTLIALLSLSVYLFGDDSSYGSNQIVLIISALVAAIVGMKNGLSWNQLESAMHQGIAIALGAILILLAVGMLIGSWILSGTVPTMIYYGLQLLDPGWFYAASCLMCAMVSVCIGSSWTTAGTVGIGLMGIAAGFGLSPEITAGAIISGAYFGDKLSPLSETTNLAPAVTGVELFDHIRHLSWTTIPSFIIAMSAFIWLGMGEQVASGGGEMDAMIAVLDQQFNVSGWLLLPLLAVLLLAWLRVPALASILIGALLGALMALLLQRDNVVAFAAAPELALGLQLFKGIWTSFYDGYQATTGNEVIDKLLSRGGMSSMLNTVWLILCAMVFGAVMERTGLLARLIRGVLGMVNSTGSLIVATIGTCIGTNVVAADQYISIILPGRMFKVEFARRGLSPLNLSRTIEDGGTITSPLIPWNTCGAYMAGTLGVATLAYLPYAFFNLLGPLVAIIYGYCNIKIARIEQTETPELMNGEDLRPSV